MKHLKTPMLRAATFTVATLGVLSMSMGEANAFPWSTDMMNQQSIKPQEQTKPFPKRSVPVSGIPSAEWADRDATDEIANPTPADAASIAKGKMLFSIYCTACHGMTGRAESEVAKRGMPATDLTDEAVQVEMTDGWLFGTITFGSGIMPPYGRAGDQDGLARGSNDLSVAERWHVVNYVKHQLKADADAAGPLPE
jgi:mono/diheme cytochrome c family protein